MRMLLHRARWAFLLSLGCLALAGCDELPGSLPAVPGNADCGANEICGAASAERVRTIKPFIVTQLATGSERRFSGEIGAANAAPLSFPVGGRVETIDVAEGDRVAPGALLATLDAVPFELNVEAAKADLKAAQSAERALFTDLQRQRELQANGWISQAALDQAEVEYDNVSSQVSVAQSRATLAERDLASTRLLAPFQGVVSSLEVQPFTEVRPGQTVAVLQSGDAFEVIVSVPDTQIDQIALGSPVAIDVTSTALCGCLGNIIEIGAISSAGNAVDVVVGITQSPSELRAGMSAEVTVSIGDAEAAAGYFIPLAAIAPGPDDQSAVVYRFDDDAGVVRRTPVRFVGSIAGEAVAVEGLEAGDIIAAAGVSFLRDRQAVRLPGREQ